MRDKLIRAVKDIEKWSGDAYFKGDDIDQALDMIKEVIAEMDKSQSISGKIADALEGYRLKKELKVKMDELGVYVGAKGYSTKTGEEEDFIMIEQCHNKLRLIVWSDINEEDPTHIIDLSGAKETSRIDK